MKFLKFGAKRLAEFAVLLAVELATTFVLSQLSGVYFFFDIVALLVVSVVFDAISHKWNASSTDSEKSQARPKKPVVRRSSIVRFRGIRARSINKTRYR